MKDRSETQNLRLVIFARYPVAGRAKTRLIPEIGESGAAKVHKILAQHVIETLSKVANESGVRCVISYTGGRLEQFKQWLNDERLEYVEQPDGDLSDRLLASLEPTPVIFFGSDTPDLTETHVQDAIAGLNTYDVVIGPALDGGYYLIGMNNPYEILLGDMPWSSDQVLAITLSRCKDMGLKVYLLETLSDCDMPDDLNRWPWLRDAMHDVCL